LSDSIAGGARLDKNRWWTTVKDAIGLEVKELKGATRRFRRFIQKYNNKKKKKKERRRGKREPLEEGRISIMYKDGRYIGRRQ
jgi:uncharacterized protein YjbK